MNARALPTEVFEPFHSALPPLKPYWRALWARRGFISEFSRSDLREKHFDSLFGQLWLILNPLLLSGVYFLLIVIIGGHSDKTRYAHLTACLFLFYAIANAMIGGVKSVTAGQRLILNTAFPRIMLPMSATLVSLIRFLPTIAVFLVIKGLLGLPFTFQMFWAIPIIAIAFLLGLGLAILFSCINVYFRDIATFLPYFNRSWLYLSPILYEASALKPKLRPLEHINPLFPLLDSWSRVMVHGEAPSFSQLGVSLLWALGFLIIGTYFFLSREREFAVRV